MIDTLSNAVANAIQSAVTTAYRETFNQVVVPSFEKAATNMFQQTNEVFRRGTKECRSCWATFMCLTLSGFDRSAGDDRVRPAAAMVIDAAA